MCALEAYQTPGPKVFCVAVVSSRIVLRCAAPDTLSFNIFYASNAVSLRVCYCCILQLNNLKCVSLTFTFMFAGGKIEEKRNMSSR